MEDITYTTVQSGGRISNTGGGDITSRGLVWDTVENPTVERHAGLNNEGSGERLFFITLIDLKPATNYYLRAYATNSAGTAYGDEVAFMTKIPVGVVESNSLVISVETQADVDLGRTASLMNGIKFDNGVVWESNLNDYNIPESLVYPYSGVNFPSDVKLSFSISSSGYYSMKVSSPYSPENVFSILSFRKYMQPRSTRKFINWTTVTKPLPADYYKNTFDPLLITSPLQAIMSYEFGYLRENYGIISGPDSYYEFGRKVLDSYILKSGFSKPIFYVFSMIHHTQSNFPGYNSLLREIDRYYNSKFSMAPLEIWNSNFSGKRKYKITAAGVVHSLLFGKIVCDNNNSAYSKLDDVRLIELTNGYSKEIYKFYPPTSASVELGVSSVYALTWNAMCYFACADNLTVGDWVEERDGVINPTDSWDKNPKPLIFKIDNKGIKQQK
ncbi:MAG: hypothetical protein WCE64_08205 [Bacteroidales bacterium]